MLSLNNVKLYCNVIQFRTSHYCKIANTSNECSPLEQSQKGTGPWQQTALIQVRMLFFRKKCAQREIPVGFFEFEN